MILFYCGHFKFILVFQRSQLEMEMTIGKRPLTAHMRDIRDFKIQRRGR